MSKLEPNFTQIPNVFFDEWLPELEKGEMKVLLYVMRRTYGFHKERDSISFSQLISGIKNLDLGTALGIQTLSRAISSLEKKGLLIVGREKMTNTYELNFNYKSTTIIELLPKQNQSTTIIEPQLLPKPNTQKKVSKESIQKKEKPQSPNRKVSFLKELPEEYVKEITFVYDISRTELILKGEQLHQWVVSKGKENDYKNFQAFISGAISRDFKKKAEKKVDVLDYEGPCY